MYDAIALKDIWNSCLLASPWSQEPVWLHADLLPGNLLMREDRLSAVIDFGMAGAGDPACDLLPAWCLFDKETRSIFREAVGADEDQWVRGKGWALSIGLIIIPYYLKTNSELVGVARRMIDEILNEET